ncbi:MAG: hypothetical protein V4719_08785 [Planctomycetota bacterium]
MIFNIPDDPRALPDIIVELKKEYRYKTIVFCLVVCIALASFGSRKEAAQMGVMIPLFAIAVDLMSVRRCLRICRALGDRGVTPVL